MVQTPFPKATLYRLREAGSRRGSCRMKGDKGHRAVWITTAVRSRTRRFDGSLASSRIRSRPKKQTTPRLAAVRTTKKKNLKEQNTTSLVSENMTLRTPILKKRAQSVVLLLLLPLLLILLLDIWSSIQAIYHEEYTTLREFKASPSVSDAPVGPRFENGCRKTVGDGALQAVPGAPLVLT